MSDAASSGTHTSCMTDTRPESTLTNPSPALGLSVLGLVAFVGGGSLLLNLPEATSGMARTGGLILLGLGLFAIMVGAAAVGVRLTRLDR
jgi:hypothetical protein